MQDMSARATFRVLCLCVVCGLAHAAAQPAPTSRPAVGAAAVGAVVTGKVTSEGEVPLSEMVVYLERTDGPAAAARGAVTPPSPAQVSQKGAKFSPPLLLVTVGQAVEFLNDEDRAVEHNVFSNAPAKQFDLGLYPPPEKKTVTFDKAGPVFLYCSIHRFMDGVIYVCPTPYHSLVADDGTYRIETVPPGTYTLKTWQRRRRFPEKSVPVDLTNSQAETVNLELRRR